MDNAFSQDGFDRRFEWGPRGLSAVLSSVDVVVIVDVLSFSTAVDVAVGRGAIVYPARWKDARAAELARAVGAELVVGRSQMSREHPYSLSPASLLTIPARTRLMLPSPNGASIAADAQGGDAAVFAGCIRNAAATAAAASRAGHVVGVVAAGEQWPDGSLRPALEDLVGAGVILAALRGRPSPEAQAAIHVARDISLTDLASCASSRELIAQGYEDDVQLALAANVSGCAARLQDGAFATAGRRR